MIMSGMKEEGLFGPIEGKSASQGKFVRSDKASLVRVAFDNAGNNQFDYALPEGLEQPLSPGQRVRAPLGRGNRPTVGFCVELSPDTTVEKVKYIDEIVDTRPLLDESMIELARWISAYYCCPLGIVLSAMVPAAVKRQVGMIRQCYVHLTDKGRLAPLKNGTDQVRLSSKGREIISHLKEKEMHHTDFEHKSVKLRELKEKLQCGQSPFKTLARQGLIEIVYRRELPQPKLPENISAKPTIDFELNEDQRKALEYIERLIDQDGFEAVLLQGVTGSGKTDVYMRCIEKVLEKGRQALVLVPEISLTPQTVSRFLGRFERVAVLHSGLTSQQRNQYWRWIADGQAEVVVGARSAVFAPLPRLGLIVVDEEHEPGYKQDKSPRYHARNVAIKRAHLNDICVILGSATPSLESLHNCQQKKHYHLLELPRRVMNLPLPKVAIVNMQTEACERKGVHILSRQLEAEMKRSLARNKQTILLLNRRGHSNYMFCPSCQFTLTCPNCDVNLTYHRSRRDFDSRQRQWVMCHHCLHSSQVPELCSLCGKKLRLIGPGTQRAEDEIQRKFPQARLRRVDSDSMKAGQIQKTLAEFGKGMIDILVGTQMIGKGLDFPNVELVGVLNADTALSLPDFRSSERTFQLIAQVAGRCGRMQDTGRVVVQSYITEEPAIRFACSHDYKNFAKYEMNIRRRCEMPPFSRLARIIMRDPKLAKLEQAAKALRERIDLLIGRFHIEAQVRGPMPAGIARLENYHRQEIIIKAQRPEPIQTLLYELHREQSTASPVQTAVDVDPIFLL